MNNQIWKNVVAQIEQARIAQAQLEKLTDKEIRKIVLGCAWAVLEPTRNQEFSRYAVETTGIGKVSDKVIKNERKTLGLLRDVLNATTFGVLREDKENGIIEIARPIGVIGAITPSTNPIATPLNNIINSLICRNAIIISPSPKGSMVLDRVLDAIDKELKKLGSPEHIIQRLPSPVSKESTQALMQQVDLIVCTGSRNNVRNSYSSGVPALGVGVGNAAVIIDESAELEEAAKKIRLSKTFDHATSCSSENSLIIVDSIYQPMLECLKSEGGYLLSPSEKQKLEKTMWPEGKLSPKIIAQPPTTLLELANIPIDRDKGEPSFIMVEETGAGKDFKFSWEKLSPVLTIYKAENFTTAKNQAREIINFEGTGHSVGIHTTKLERAKELGIEFPVGRVIVNQAHCFATGGSFDNGLPFSLSMGCGSWGKNSFSDNLHYRHFYNTVKVAYPITARTVDRDQLFKEYLDQ